MIDYYNYDTSPRKLEPDYEMDIKVKEKPTKKKTKKTNKKAVMNKQKRKQNVQNSKASQNAVRIFYITVGFLVLLVISYRYAIINSSFAEKEALKSKLEEMQKLNQQLKVNIEQGMNINNIEQEAKERLGMQKLDNNQKVYINLDKSDYVESSIDATEEEKVDSWWSKLLKDLLKIR